MKQPGWHIRPRRVPFDRHLERRKLPETFVPLVSRSLLQCEFTFTTNKERDSAKRDLPGSRWQNRQLVNRLMVKSMALHSNRAFMAFRGSWKTDGSSQFHQALV